MTTTPAMPELPDSATVLPDGSAFAIASFPLPSDHWLYAPREYRDGEEEPIELPPPILSHQAHGDVVSAAIRYAVRSATMCGKEPDFDPDALVRNAMYALCGPFGGATLQAQPAAKCDGNHGGPRCADPECWNDDPPAKPAEVSDDDLQAIDDAHNWQTLKGRMAAYRAILALRPQAEPVGLDVEAMIQAVLPGGYSCDPQQVADAIRAYMAQRPQAESEARRAAQDQLYTERERHTAEVKRLQAEIGRLQSLRPQAVPMTEGDDSGIPGMFKTTCPWCENGFTTSLPSLDPVSTRARLLSSEELADCCGGCASNSAIETWMRRAIAKFCEVNGITAPAGGEKQA